MPQFDKNGKVIQPTYSTGVGNPASSPTSSYGGAIVGGANPSQVGYQPGMSTPNLPANSTQATSQAQQAVQGLTSAGAPSAGAGSSYSLDSTGHVTSTVTPNLLPQQADLQAKQTQLEGQIAAESAKAGAGYGSAASAQTAAQGQAAAAQQEALGQQAFSSQLAALSPYLGTGGSPQIGFGGSGSAIGGGMSPQEQAARAAAFARAKEQAGGTARAAMTGLQGAMDNRGLTGSTGSGLESGGMADIMGGAAGAVNDTTREQLISDLNRYSGIADETYQGNITQRGQDLQQRQALLGLIGRGVQY